MELLVVMTIITILVAMVATFMPRMGESQRAYKGADMVQGALMIAKQRALRDQRPSGIRLIQDPNNPGFVSEVQYIQIPEDFATGRVKSVNGSSVTFAGANFTAGLPRNLAPVQAGDSLEICGGGLPHRIASVGGSTLTVASPFMNPITNGSYAYRVMRTPRLLAGEPSITLPDSIAIDMRSSGVGPFGQPGLTGTWGRLGTTFSPADILFSPAGGVIFQGVIQPCDLIVLWVRNTTLPPMSGSPALIAIQARTGFIAAHPVNPNGDPYAFTKDNKSSGM
jgi:hypothetical protein